MGEKFRLPHEKVSVAYFVGIQIVLTIPDQRIKDVRLFNKVQKSEYPLRFYECGRASTTG